MYERENPIRGRDESVNSLNRGMYLEALQFLRDHKDKIYAVTLENAPKFCILISRMIQKDIVYCFAKEILNCICLEIGNDVFSFLVDESSDMVKKDQMVMVLSYNDKVTTEQAICVVLHYVEEEGDIIFNRGRTSSLINDQTILEAVLLVKGTKRSLLEYWVTCFASLLKNLTSFCGKHDIEMVNMDDFHSRGRMDRITNQHHFEVDIFNKVMDL
ncbi:zinc finger MYM-type protein 1-like protein [Tanacetum coccineum]